MTTKKTKNCSKCGQVYPNTKVYFRLAKTCKDGLSNVCRACHQDHIRAWKKDKGIVNPDHEFAPYTFGKKCSKSKPVNKKRHILYSSDVIRTAKIFRQGILNRSQKHNLQCDKKLLTINYFCELLTHNVQCECCKVILDMSPKKIGCMTENSPTIDKIIPKLGYTINNIAILCWKCNTVKNNASLSELKNLLSWMKSHVSI